MASEEMDATGAKERSVHTVDLTEGDTDPQLHLVHAVADITGVEETRLEALYPTIDGMVDQLYSDPPSARAQAELTFVYEGFRITLFQDGTAVFQQQPPEPNPNR